MITVVIFSVLITQSSATFFSEITGALGTVKSKVGKLFTDVGHDLRDTVDCAIDAVEEVIYDKDQIPKYYDKCKETTTEAITPNPLEVVPQSISIFIKPIELPGISEVTTKSGILLNNRDIEKELAKVETVVNNEYYHVDNMSSLLEKKFDGLSKDVDDKLRAIEKEKTDLQKSLLEIKLLHLEEEREIEKTKDEVRDIFEEILKKINSSTNESDLKSEMKAAVRDIEINSSKTILEEIEKWKDKGMLQLQDIRNTEANKIQSTTELNTPRTFKELASKIFNDTRTITITTDNTATDVLKLHSTSTIRPISTEALAFSTTTPSSASLITETSTTATTTVKLISQTTEFALNKLVSSSTVSILNSIPPDTVSSTVSTNKAVSFTTTVVPTTVKNLEILTTTTKKSVISTTLAPTSPKEPEIPTTTPKTTVISTTVSPSTISTEVVTRTSTVGTSTMIPLTKALTTSKKLVTTKSKKYSPNRAKKNKKKNKPKHQVSKQSLPPPSEFDEFAPKDPLAAVADALKIFGESMKTKAVLDNFFKNMDNVPVSKVF